MAAANPGKTQAAKSQGRSLRHQRRARKSVAVSASIPRQIAAKVWYSASRTASSGSNCDKVISSICDGTTRKLRRTDSAGAAKWPGRRATSAAYQPRASPKRSETQTPDSDSAGCVTGQPTMFVRSPARLRMFQSPGIAERGTRSAVSRGTIGRRTSQRAECRARAVVCRSPMKSTPLAKRSARRGQVDQSHRDRAARLNLPADVRSATTVTAWETPRRSSRRPALA